MIITSNQLIKLFVFALTQLLKASHFKRILFLLYIDEANLRQH